MKKNLLLMIALGCLLSCGKKDMSVKKYYFPYENFIKPKIYQYDERKDTAATMYWYFKTTVKGSDTLLTTFIYNSAIKLTNIYQNIISEQGCILKEMLVNTGDSTAMMKYNVKENEVFLWKIKPNQKLALSFSISNQDGSESEEVVTERGFEPKKEFKNYNGNQYECILVKDVTMVNHIKINRTIGEEQQRNSFFAKGIGLLEFETFNPDGSSTYFTLNKIMTEDEWKKRLMSSPDSGIVWKRTDGR